MAKYCPYKDGPALYLECKECEDRACETTAREVRCPRCSFSWPVNISRIPVGGVYEVPCPKCGTLARRIR